MGRGRWRSRRGGSIMIRIEGDGEGSDGEESESPAIQDRVLIHLRFLPLTLILVSSVRRHLVYIISDSIEPVLLSWHSLLSRFWFGSPPYTRLILG